MNHRDPDRDRGVDPALAAADLLAGFQRTLMIVAAVDVGLFEALRDGPVNARTLSGRLHVDESALRRLIDALRAHELLAGDSAGVRLTSLSRSLLADDASGLAGWARLIGEPWIWQMWGHLPEAVRGGGSAFHAAHGCSFWEFVDAHADAATVFHEGMSALSRADARAVVPRLDLRDCRLIVDVGGGHGVLLTACLQKATGGRGVLYDRRSVVAEGIQRIRRQHLQARCHAVAGDFRTWVPSGGDLYLLKRVLQDWGEADAVAILRGCRQAMGPESRLAIIERLMPEGPDAAAAALADLTMLAAVPGRVRRREEIACLARAAGLRLVEVRSAGELSVVELRREQADAKRS